MKATHLKGFRFCWLLLFLAVSITVAAYLKFLRVDTHISVKLGEPWEDMQQRSTAKIPDVISGQHWYQTPTADASLIFVDELFGFVTPVGRFFVVSFSEDGTVRSVDMSPQTEPLAIQEVMYVVTALQEQWVGKGWRLLYPESFPVIGDTPEWRAKLKDSLNGKTVYWRAAHKYQISMSVRRYGDEDRYLITLSLSEPW